LFFHNGTTCRKEKDRERGIQKIRTVCAGVPFLYYKKRGLRYYGLQTAGGTSRRGKDGGERKEREMGWSETS